MDTDRGHRSTQIHPSSFKKFVFICVNLCPSVVKKYIARAIIIIFCIPPREMR